MFIGLSHKAFSLIKSTFYLSLVSYEIDGELHPEWRLLALNRLGSTARWYQTFLFQSSARKSPVLVKRLFVTIISHRVNHLITEEGTTPFAHMRLLACI